MTFATPEGGDQRQKASDSSLPSQNIGRVRQRVDDLVRCRNPRNVFFVLAINLDAVRARVPGRLHNRRAGLIVDRVGGLEVERAAHEASSIGSPVLATGMWRAEACRVEEAPNVPQVRNAACTVRHSTVGEQIAEINVLIPEPNDANALRRQSSDRANLVHDTLRSIASTGGLHHRVYRDVVRVA